MARIASVVVLHRYHWKGRSPSFSYRAMISARRWSDLAALHDDPRFQELVKS